MAKSDQTQAPSDSTNSGPGTPTIDSDDAVSWDLPEIIPKPTMTSLLVDTALLIQQAVDVIASIPSLALYVDLEGQDLGRTGDIVTLQLFVASEKGDHAFIFGVWVLRNLAFDTPGHMHPAVNLRSLLEDSAVPILFWDCRMDSEALFWQYKIRLSSVIDLQLMELGQRLRWQSKQRLGGYASAVENDARLGNITLNEMLQIKTEGQARFLPKYGGSWDFLKARPMAPELVEYCLGDIMYLRELFAVYALHLSYNDHDDASMSGTKELTIIEPVDFLGNLAGKITRKVWKDSRGRIERSQGEGWDRAKDDMRLSHWEDPWGARYNSRST